MEFVVALFLVVFGGCIVSERISSDKCRGDIIDIYYPLGQEYAAYHIDCPYTKTMINCSNCQKKDVSRNHYEKYIYNEFIKYNREVIFPKRTDVDNLYPPRNNLGYRGG